MAKLAVVVSPIAVLVSGCATAPEHHHAHSIYVERPAPITKIDAYQTHTTAYNLIDANQVLSPPI